MATLAAQVSPIYPTRLVLFLGPLIGPLYSVALGPFDPRRDVEVYVDGSLSTIQSFGFDKLNNRYLLFMAQPLNIASRIQVIHHMPLPPFGLKRTSGFGASFATNFAS